MGEKSSQWLKKHEAIFIKIIRWLIFGVIVSLLPYWFVLSLYPASDLLTSELESLLDLLLISIAVLANTVNLFWGKEKKISSIFRTLSLVFLIITMCYCAYTYGVLFDQTIWNNKMLEEYNKLTDPFEKDFVDSEGSEGSKDPEGPEGYEDSEGSEYFEGSEYYEGAEYYESSEDFSNNSDYKDIMQQLTSIKSLTDKVGTKTEKLKQLRRFSKIVLIIAAILGVIVECIDDRNRRKKRKRDSKTKNTDKPTLPPSDAPQNPPSTEDGE